MIASYGNCEIFFMICECLNIFYCTGITRDYSKMMSDKIGGKFEIRFKRPSETKQGEGWKSTYHFRTDPNNILKNIHVSKHNRLQLVLAFFVSISTAQFFGQLSPNGCFSLLKNHKFSRSFLFWHFYLQLGKKNDLEQT